VAAGRIKLVFDEHFSEKHVVFVGREADLGDLHHVNSKGLKWSGKPDKDWIPIAIKGNFVIVTGDRNDKTREVTIEDLKRMNAQVILVGPFWDHWNRWERAKWLVASIERIVYVASTMTPGSAKVLVNKHCLVRDL
jgi:hypothetical protein